MWGVIFANLLSRLFAEIVINYIEKKIDASNITTNSYISKGTLVTFLLFSLILTNKWMPLLTNNSLHSNENFSTKIEQNQ